MDKEPHVPSEAWKKFHAANPIVEPPKYKDGEYFWVKRLEEIEKEKEWQDFLREEKDNRAYYMDDQEIMNTIMNGEGDKYGY